MKLPVTLGLAPQADMQVCLRKGSLEGNPVQHCYIRLTDAAGNTADSISYGPDETGGPDRKPDAALQCNTIRKNITPASWERIRRYYQQTCAGKDFKFNEHDCCSCAADALYQLGEMAPSFVMYANK
ncbi:hypothetical protein [Chitinophaga vietnamensis]|uniref:hypothetical protein n=1 Tax=Chitinophaga vietnamensis TaxID=2593957 RepID=UPI0011782D84|nr:hypothetical protein [Chitinophaga vietnamensis]